MKFEINKNLFRIEGGYIGTQNRILKEGEWFYVHHNKAIRQWNEIVDKGEPHYVSVIIFATHHFYLDLGVPRLKITGGIFEDKNVKEAVSKGMDFVVENDFEDPTNTSFIFAKGFLKAKEKYSFTLEDMKKAISLAQTYKPNTISGNFSSDGLYQEEEILKEFVKEEIQELEIEDIDGEIIVKNGLVKIKV